MLALELLVLVADSLPGPQVVCKLEAGPVHGFHRPSTQTLGRARLVRLCPTGLGWLCQESTGCPTTVASAQKSLTADQNKKAGLYTIQRDIPTRKLKPEEHKQA